MKSCNTERKRRSGPLVMRIVYIVALILSVALMPAAAKAVSVTGDSNTYLQSRETEDKTKLVNAYEYLNFTAQDMGNITFQFGGWVRYDLGAKDPSETSSKVIGPRSEADIQYGYLSYRSPENNAVVNLGRLLIMDGVGAGTRVNGLYGRTDLANGFGISAFGGTPVETETDTPGNNVIYGARLSHQVPGLYRIGLSAVKEVKDSNAFRKEEEIDVWLHPMDKVELMGNSRFNSMPDKITDVSGVLSDWENHTYNLVLGPFDKVRFTTEASLVNYESYFTGATTPVFSFQPGVIDPSERVRIVGETVAYDLTKTLSASIDYKSYSYRIAGSASAIGGSLRYREAKSGGAGVSIRRTDGDSDRLRYMEYRAYGYRKLDKIDLTADVLDVRYSEAINGVRDAYTLSVAAAYELSERLKVSADAEYSKNPDFDKDIRTMAKLTYSFDVGTGGYGEGGTKEGKP